MGSSCPACAQHTDTHTTLRATSVTVGRIGVLSATWSAASSCWLPTTTWSSISTARRLATRCPASVGCDTATAWSIAGKLIYIGRQRPNFVPYLYQQVFATILWVKLSEMFLTALCWSVNDHRDTVLDHMIQFYLNNALNLRPLTPHTLRHVIPTKWR